MPRQLRSCHELTRALRAYLIENLPAYMVPALFVALESLPRLPNGKLDRLSLPEPDLSALRSAEYVAPRTAAEQPRPVVRRSVGSQASRYRG